MRNVFKSNLVLLAALTLSGCSSTPNWMEWAKGGKPCPPVTIHEKAGSLAVASLSKGDPRTLTISDIDAACGVMPENMELIDEQDVGIVFTATVPSAPYDANISPDLKWIDVPVFIALLDKGGKVVERRDYDFSMTISQQSTWTKQRVAFPLPENVKPDAAGYRIVVGLNKPQSKKAATDSQHHSAHGKKHKHKKHHGKKHKKHTEDTAKVIKVADHSQGKDSASDASSKTSTNSDSPSFGMTKVG